jgi:hypothetical protein
VGKNPYTYSDFTGYGLQHFVRPQGRYLYQMQPCSGSIKATWKEVRWKATTPENTSLEVRVRSGNSATSLGDWVGPFSKSPADLGQTSTTPLSPNPSQVLQVEFILKTHAKQSSPILHDFQVSYSCIQDPA